MLSILSSVKHNSASPRAVRLPSGVIARASSSVASAAIRRRLSRLLPICETSAHNTSGEGRDGGGVGVVETRC